MAGSCNVQDSQPEAEIDLVSLMCHLKLENPEMSRKGMLEEVHYKGPEWEHVTFDQIKRSWKKMAKKNKATADAASAETSCFNGKHLQNKLDESTTEKKQNKTDRKKKNIETGTKNVETEGGPKSKQTAISEEEISASIQEVTDEDSNSSIPSTSANRRSKALAKQLNMLSSNDELDYVVFTPRGVGADVGISLSNIMGRIFFKVMWNRVTAAPWGSPTIKRELWMIYQQIEDNLPQHGKKLLRNQLKAEFGVDPFDGR